MRRASVVRAFAAAATLFVAAGLAACQGCQPPAQGPDTPGSSNANNATTPTLRLYVLSAVAGALEPCGCTKDQLGGFDHLAAFVAKEKTAAPTSLAIGAGPLFYMEPTVSGEGAQQARWKAEAIAQATKQIGAVGWAPGVNDFGGGKGDFERVVNASQLKPLALNLDPATVKDAGAPVMQTITTSAGPLKIAILGVTDPKDRAGKYPEGVTPKPALETLKAAISKAKADGARLLIGVAALPRGEALRLADQLPELQILVVGKPFEAGETNDTPKPPIIAGTSTLVVESSNHLQTVGVVDLFIRGDDKAPLVFADASGVAKADELISLTGRIRDLEARINSWERDKTVKAEDVAARKADLAKLRDEKTKLEQPQPAPAGSFFRYKNVEIRGEMGADKAVGDQMLAFYKRVNEHNKTEFAGRKPAAVGKDESSYVGVEECTTCHEDARKVWDKTSHASAYVTLEKQFKEFNLDCVSCHVTGYGKPGGSTVTAVEKLKGVQCEECHGPGSKHAKSAKKEDVLIAVPKPEFCAAQCHHPPHVEGYDPIAKRKLILGPGHGEKK
jgi:hypothetical protein